MILRMQRLQQFLKRNEIPLQQLRPLAHRYIRIIGPPYPLLQNLHLKLGLQHRQLQHTPIPQIKRIPQSCKLKGKQPYQQGLIAGIDYSSACVIKCLDPKQDQQVLDLCCAPGAKLSYICQLAKHCLGVDISQNRMNTCRSILNKYGIKNFQLVVQDGCSVKLNREFDKVLVDAQCTHQGSYKHIKKFDLTAHRVKKIEKTKTSQQRKQFALNSKSKYAEAVEQKNEWCVQDFQQRFLNQKRLNILHQLQQGLLQNGFRHLKVDGLLVYSTCSFSPLQNQELISRFLDRHPEEAKCLSWPQSQLLKVKASSVGYRCSPSVSQSGGMFMVRIKKMR